MSRWVLVAFLLLGLAQAELPKVEVLESGFPGDQQVGHFLGCSLGCAIGWSLAVGDHLADSQGLKYGAREAGDGNFRTCWAARVSPRAWIEFRMSKERPGADWRGFTLVNGYSKSERLWERNSRVKSIRVELNGKSIGVVELLDTPSVQAVSIEAVKVRAGDVIRMTVLDTYPGTHYPEFCLSEVVLDGAH